MNVCFMLGGFYNNGGIGRVTSIVANLLVGNENFKVHTLSYAKENKPYLYELDKRIFDDHFLEKRESMSKVLFGGGIKKLKKYIEENHIDVMIACGALFFPICSLACRKIPCKCICWEHSNGNNNADYRFQGLCKFIGSKYSDAILNITKQDQNIYKKKFKARRYFQIYNPVDPVLQKDDDYYNSESNRIITVGRLTYPKNYPALIKVAQKVLSSCKQWKWDIYGEGKERKKITQLIQEAGLEKKVFLKGQVSDLYNRYSQYAFLVMTSRYEGFGMALIEAASKHLPTVAFDIECGPREIIEDGINGYLIPAFDCDMMAEKIKKLCDSVELRKQFSKATIETRQKFSEKEIVVKWLEMLDVVYKS